MTGEPRLPRVRAKTGEEKDREAADRARRQELEKVDRGVRAELSRRSSHRLDHPDANPYDLAGDALMEAVGDAVFAALTSGEFRAALRRRGLALVPAPSDPGHPPADWAEQALDMMGAHGTVVFVLEHIDGLWSGAWQAGWAARAATTEQ